MIEMELNKEVIGSTLLSISLGKSEQSGDSFTSMVNAVIKHVKVNNQKFGLLNTSEIHKLNCYASILWGRKECPKKGNSDWAAIKKEGDERAEKDWNEWQSVNAPSIELLKKEFPAFEIISLPTIPVENLDNVEANEKSDDEKNKMLSAIRGYYSYDKKFSHAVIQLANAFFKKNFIKDSSKNEEKQSSNEECKKEIILGFYREYILRESAARLLLPFDFEIYKGSINIPAYYAQRQYIAKGKMEFVSVGTKEEIAKYNKTNAGLIKSNNNTTIKQPASTVIEQSPENSTKTIVLSESSILPIPFEQQDGSLSKPVQPTIIIHAQNIIYLGYPPQSNANIIKNNETVKTSEFGKYCYELLQNIISTCSSWGRWLIRIDVDNNKTIPTSGANNLAIPELHININPLSETKKITDTNFSGKINNTSINSDEKSTQEFLQNSNCIIV